MTVDELEALIRRIIPKHEAAALLDGESGPVYRAIMRIFEALSVRRRERTQATYLLPNAIQTDEPATLGRRTRLSVTLKHGGNLDRALKITPGACVLEGPSGRLYVNTDTIEWARRDTETSKVARFECVVGGVAGNLDFLVNDEHAAEPNLVPLGYVILSDQSRGRANNNARTENYQGAMSVRDDGRPATFEAQDKGLYVEILNSPNAPQNNGRIMRIDTHVWPGIEDPAGSNVRPSYAVLDSTPRDYWKSAKLDDGGVFTTHTDQLNDYALADVPLLPVAPAVNDAFYFGATTQISEIYLDMHVAGAGVYTLVWEVWDGFNWIDAQAIDNTNGLRASGSVKIQELTTPTTVDGVNAFWVRARVSAFTSLTAEPTASYGFPRLFDPLLTDPGPVQWAIRDWSDLGVEIAKIIVERPGRNDDLFMLGDQRGMYLQKGETEEQFRRRISKMPDAIAPNALTRAINRILAPLRLRGRVIDKGDEFTGIWGDVDFLDYYGPGDQYPEDPWKLLLSLNEANGWFYALLPQIAEGDFGIFMDEGPTLYLPDKGLYLGPCCDEGFTDGYSYTASVIYGSIYEELRHRKMGGVGFVMLLDPSLNAP